MTNPYVNEHGDLNFGGHGKLADLHKLFDVVCIYVLESGGDGAGEVISANYEKYAWLFQNWDNPNGQYFCHGGRYETVGESVTFMRDQESITFIRERREGFGTIEIAVEIM